MRIAHLSDTHLGYAEYDARDPDTGLNVRELDVYRAFEHACAAIARLKPDLVVHSGDLFDHPRPPNRAIVTALREFARLARDGIAVVLAAGNHSLPGARATACILEGLEAIPGVHAAFDRPRRIEAGAASVLAIPHARSEADLLRAVEQASPDPAAPFNVLVVHAGLRGGPPREWTEARIPFSLIRARAARFDYVALGHYHRRLKVAPMAWYAGATERFHEERTRGAKGFLLADLAARTVVHHPVPTRPVVELPPLDCRGLSPPEILHRLAEAEAGVPAGSILRLTLEGLGALAADALDPAAVRRRLGRALHVDLRLSRRRGPRLRPVHEFPAGNLSVQFEAFVAERLEDPETRRKVLSAARGYLDRAQEAHDG